MAHHLRNPIAWVLIGLSWSGPWAATARSEPPGGASPKSSYVLVVTAAKRVHDELTFEFNGPKLRAREWVVYVPQLPELSGQKAVRSTLYPSGRKVKEAGGQGRPLLVTRVPVLGAKWREGMTVRVEYEANLLGRRLERREPDAASPKPPPVAPPGKQERALALAAGHQFDFTTPAFQAWLDAQQLRRAPEEEAVDFARRVFVALKRHFKSGSTPDRLASHVCAAKKADGGGLAILFVSALRANKIPARVLAGRWAFPSETSQGQSQGQNAAEEPHVKAEFFAEGVGWVPADIGAAVKLDKTEEGLDYFGKDEPDFLTLHVDTDMELDTVFFGRRTMEWLQSASFWVLGSGTFDGLTNPSLSKITADALDPADDLSKPPAATRAAAPAAAKRAAPAAKTAASAPGIAVSGTVIDRRDNWISVKADGEDAPVKYVIPDQPSRRLLLDLQGVFTVARVRLVYEPDGENRRLVDIKKVVIRSTGTVTGEVLNSHGWWVEVKPRNGPPEGYAAPFPFDKYPGVMEQLKKLKTGDVVTIQFFTDFERHRIQTLAKRAENEK